jgi:hypothetical protein
MPGKTVVFVAFRPSISVCVVPQLSFPARAHVFIILDLSQVFDFDSIAGFGGALHYIERD